MTLDPKLRRLLNELDGHLGLAVYRGEGRDQRWKAEAEALIIRIREFTKAAPIRGTDAE